MRRWDVTFAIRAADGNGKPVTIRLALPEDTPVQRISDVHGTSRGFDLTVVEEPGSRYVLLRGRLREPQRFAVHYQVQRVSEDSVMPPIHPVDEPSPALIPFLSPSPIFQSRSILVREFLETRAAPLLAGEETDVVRAIFTATREQLTWRSTGKTLTLDVIRSGKGKRIGIERALTTFLRCARIPARFVEGINLDSTTRRKRVFWTEAWASNEWWPMSVSRAWVGHLPISYVALTRDGEPVIRVEGTAEATYTVLARAIDGSP